MKTVLLALILAANPALADIAVVVNPQNTSNFDATEIRNIFLGKSKAFSNGEIAIPLILDKSNDETEEFMVTIQHK